MANTYGVDAPAIALTAATALYMLGVATPSTSDLDFIDFLFGADATAAGTLKVELLSWTTDGTGTAYTPSRLNGSAQNRPSLATAKIDYTSAPSGTLTIIKTWMFVLPTGGFEIQEPLGRDIYMGPGKFYGIRFTSSVACNGYAHVEFEE